MRLGVAESFGAWIVLGGLLVAPGWTAGQWAVAQAGTALSIPAAVQMQPKELDRLLRVGGAEKPLVLQVGSQVLFQEAHIQGAEYAGPGARDAGLTLLHERVAHLPRNTFIVIYCGCCPWSHCPNIDPAYNELRKMGFTRVKVLYLADNFGADWVNLGFPVASGH